MYDFSTLNDKDLELLVLDLFNSENELDLQSFKVGKDQGIDLRYSTPKNNNSIVVQVKHYLKSGNKLLLRDLKKKELPKVKALNPDRYIIATSVQMSAKEKDEIKELFYPYILDSNDVISVNDLNYLLRKHTNVEKRHFKLWFSSTAVLEQILNNGIEGRSKSQLQHISRKIGLYVPTKSLEEADKILEKEKLLLITGYPGIGKTTLANILLYEKARNNYQVYFITSVHEAEKILSEDVDLQQVFYFDDFLGEVYYEIMTGSQLESSISQFVDRIKYAPNKYLILSTRTVILEQAKLKSEKIKRSKLETGHYELVLTDYTNFQKAQILYNHIYFQDVTDNMKSAIFEDEFYNMIIYHKNYTPRLIEFLTEKSRFGNLSKDEYRQSISMNLTNPEEIWRSSFENQISYFDQCLLITLFTFQRNVEESILEKAFNSRLQYERKENNKDIRTDQFKLCVKSLLNGFITSRMVNVDNKTKQYNLINPSLSDFILEELKSNESLRIAVISSMKYIEQFQFFDPRKANFTFDPKLNQLIISLIEKDELDCLDCFLNDEKEVNLLNILNSLNNEDRVDEICLNKLKSLDYKYTEFYEKEICEFLMNLGNVPKTTNYIKNNIAKILTELYSESKDSFLADNLPNILSKYGYSVSKLNEIDGLNLNLEDYLNKVINSKELELFESKKDEINSVEDLDEFIYQELDKVRTNWSSSYKLAPEKLKFSKCITNEDLNNQIEQNQIAIKEAEKRAEERKSLSDSYYDNYINEKNQIKDLFYQSED
jgi:hypothetical protein